MADLIDKFNGSAGALTSHTSDSGHTWSTPNSAYAVSSPTIDGTGSMTSVVPTVEIGGRLAALSSWTPPANDYSATIVIGASFRTMAAGGWVGLHLRAGGGSTGFGYIGFLSVGTPDVLQLYITYNTGNSYTCATQIGSSQNLASQVVADDQFTFKIVGSPPQITVYRNGTQIYQVTQSGGCSAIPSANKVGILNRLPTGSTGTDLVRGIWAGAVASGPPAGTFDDTPLAPRPTVIQFDSSFYY